MFTKILFLAVFAVMAISTGAFAMCGSCGSDMEHKEGAMTMSAFSHAAEEATMKGGVKEISYGQFMAIKKSGEKFTLLDVLPPDSYSKGHIKGAVSFPGETINKDSAAKMLSKDGNIVVYCGSFQCPASTGAAKKLAGLGYNVLDYKGGLKEWEEKGNSLVSGE